MSATAARQAETAHRWPSWVGGVILVGMLGSLVVAISQIALHNRKGVLLAQAVSYALFAIVQLNPEVRNGRWSWWRIVGVGLFGALALVFAALSLAR